MKQRHLSFMTQQLGRNRKSILSWSIIWTLLGLLFAAVFKTMSATAEQSARIYEALPPAVLKAVNISTDYLTKPENFLSGQFLTIYLLAGSIFAVILGVNAIGGKVHDKTILNYVTKRLSRMSIFLLQAAVILVTLMVMNLVVGITLLISFNLFSGSEPSLSYMVSTFIGAATVFITFAAIGLIAGVKMEKSHALAFGSAIAIISFFVNGLGALAGVPAWLQKCSLYYYFDTTHLRDFYSLDARIFVLIGLSLLLIIAGAFIFRRKNLYL